MSGKGSGATESAEAQSKQVPDRAASEASQVADTAKDQARQVKDEAAAQARGLVDQAKHELRDQGEAQTEQVARAIHRVGDQADALASGRVDEAGAVADYARQAGERVHEFADRIDRRGIDGLTDDVQNFARRKPGAFLLGGAAAGFVVGRLIRGSAAGSGDDGDSPVGSDRAPSQTPTTYA